MPVCYQLTFDQIDSSLIVSTVDRPCLEIIDEPISNPAMLPRLASTMVASVFRSTTTVLDWMSQISDFFDYQGLCTRWPRLIELSTIFRKKWEKERERDVGHFAFDTDKTCSHSIIHLSLFLVSSAWWWFLVRFSLTLDSDRVSSLLLLDRLIFSSNSVRSMNGLTKSTIELLQVDDIAKLIDIFDWRTAWWRWWFSLYSAAIYTLLLYSTLVYSSTAALTMLLLLSMKIDMLLMMSYIQRIISHHIET